MTPYIFYTLLVYLFLAFYYVQEAPVLFVAILAGFLVWIANALYVLAERSKAQSVWIGNNSNSNIHAFDVEKGWYALVVHGENGTKKHWIEIRLQPNPSGVGILPDQLAYCLAYAMNRDNLQHPSFLTARALEHLRIASKYMRAKNDMDLLPHGINKMRQSAPMSELEIYQSVLGVFAYYGQNGNEILKAYFEASAFIAGKRKVIDDVTKDFEAFQEARFKSLHLLLMQGYSIEDAMKRVENF